MGPYKHKRPKKKKGEHWTDMHTPPRTAATELGDIDANAEWHARARDIERAKTPREMNKAINRLIGSVTSFEEMKAKSPRGKETGYKARVTPRQRKGGSVSRKRGGKIMQGYKAGGKV